MTRRTRRRARPRNGPVDTRTLSIFKPVPKICHEQDAPLLAEAIGSFVAQLDERSELLLGLNEDDREVWEPHVRALRSRCRCGSLKVVFREDPDRYPNPKISWQRVLARHAQGELWLWSDADMIAPADFIATARAEMADGGQRMLTSSYVIQRVPRSAGLMEALFVNVEFYPGVQLMSRLNAIRCGFGAGMLFRAGDFRSRTSWNELGAHLAEDFVLGKRLQSVGLGSSVLVTYSHSTSWGEALRHYLRWAKTIRWCRPGGFAIQLLILPLLGWGAWVALDPTEWIRWAGLLAMWQVEVALACMICRGVGLEIGLRHVWIVAGWSLLRSLSWLACWFPWPVRWRSRLWWSPRQSKRPRSRLAVGQGTGHVLGPPSVEQVEAD